MSGQNTALIIIDMQRGMRDPAAGKRNNLMAEHNCETLLATWRQHSGTVVHVRHRSTHRNSPFCPGQPGAEFQPEFTPLPDEQVFEKQVPDAFSRSNLEQWLLAREIMTLVIVGVSTNNSVEATARTAGNLGFDTHVVADATFTFDKLDYAGVLRTAAEVHAMSLANLSEEYARIITTEQALAMIGNND